MTLLWFGVSTEEAFLFLLMVSKASALFCSVNAERQNSFYLLDEDGKRLRRENRGLAASNSLGFIAAAMAK